METWRTYREQHPNLTWPAFMRSLEMCRRHQEQARIQYQAELAAQQSYTRFHT